MEALKNFFVNKIPNIKDYVDLPVFIGEILAFTVITFGVVRLLRENKASKLYVVLLLYALVFGVVFVALGAPAFTYVLAYLIAVITIIILFATEIKRIVWGGGKINAKVSVKQAEAVKSNAGKINACINEIIKALQNMSKNDVGAIIVLSNSRIPENIINSGTRLDAMITGNLIESVFFPKTPLHDGAMIIYGDKIQAAGCFLPLSQQTDLPKYLGTRHRAGIGITETINVTSIIVSEETGIISYAQGGRITRYADSEMLRKLLKEYYWQDLITK